MKCVISAALKWTWGGKNSRFSKHSLICNPFEKSCSIKKKLHTSPLTPNYQKFFIGARHAMPTCVCMYKAVCTSV